MKHPFSILMRENSMNLYSFYIRFLYFVYTFAYYFTDSLSHLSIKTIKTDVHGVCGVKMSNMLME